MDRSFPTRKNYEYELPTIYGSVILRFAQASSAETKNDYTQFSSLTDELFADRFITLLKSRTVGYAKKRYVPSYKLRKAIRQDIVIVFHEIAKLRYVWRQSIYADHAEVKPKDHRKRWLYNTDSYLAEKCRCQIDQVRYILTDEQIGFLLDDAQRDYYETFDEWKSVNDSIISSNGRTLTASELEQKQYMLDYKKRVEEYKKQREASEKTI